jgi:hypothetical protein
VAGGSGWSDATYVIAARGTSSRRPSELRDTLARPPVVWALAVISTFSSRFISPAFMKSPDARRSREAKLHGSTELPLDSRSGIVRRSQIRELGKQIGVGPDLVPVTFPFVKTHTKASPASSVSVRPLPGKDARRVGS